MVILDIDIQKQGTMLLGREGGGSVKKKTGPTYVNNAKLKYVTALTNILWSFVFIDKGTHYTLCTETLYSVKFIIFYLCF